MRLSRNQLLSPGLDPPRVRTHHRLARAVHPHTVHVVSRGRVRIPDLSSSSAPNTQLLWRSS